ncbi:MAG: DUF1295 domain-containing protein [Paracoccaceae bacterium]
MILELALLLIAAQIMFGPWSAQISNMLGWAAISPSPARRYVIMVFSIVIFVRYIFTMFYMIKRRIPWSEAFTIPFAFALYYLGFAMLVLPAAAPLGLIDYLGIALFAFGCWLNTTSEMQRDRFKRDPNNKGKLFTSGLFAWSMHINFFGDILWVAGYAIISQNIWAALIVLFIFCFFVFFNVPKLDAYLANRYGEEFKAYALHTKRLVPLVW